MEANPVAHNWGRRAIQELEQDSTDAVCATSTASLSIAALPSSISSRVPACHPTANPCSAQGMDGRAKRPRTSRVLEHKI